MATNFRLSFRRWKKSAELKRAQESARTPEAQLPQNIISEKSVYFTIASCESKLCLALELWRL